MNIMTKRGNLDNIVTYEHICDTTADMNNIDPQYITLGSICIVINDEDSGMEVYMANSNKEWNSIAMGAGSSDGGSGASSLINLLDVEVLNPTDGQTLTYDATAQKWINSSGGSTGGPVVVHTTHDEGTEVYTLDHTWQEINDALDSGKIVIVQDKVVDGDSFSQIKQQIIYNTTFDMESTESQRYWCSIFDYESTLYSTFYCSTANDYPSIDDGSGDLD